MHIVNTMLLYLYIYISEVESQIFVAFMNTKYNKKQTRDKKSCAFKSKYTEF